MIKVARKKKVTQADIARACKLDQGSVSRILNKDTRDSFSPETIQMVFRIARELGYVHPALVSTNRRESPRRKTKIKAKVAVMLGANTVYDRGECEVHEVSTSGMLLKEFKTQKMSFPLDRFSLDLELATPPLRGIKAKGNVVRFLTEDNEFAIAVKYLEIDEEDLKRISKFIK